MSTPRSPYPPITTAEAIEQMTLYLRHDLDSIPSYVMQRAWFGALEQLAAVRKVHAPKGGEGEDLYCTECGSDSIALGRRPHGGLSGSRADECRSSGTVTALTTSTEPP